MHLPLISVIVPVYKVEAYLDKCISSIVSQTYTNLEIILVDDGSPGNCPAICDSWAVNDNRIKVIHKANGGLSDARNAGMAIATGELMGFIDSDDWVEPEMYQLLYENLVTNDCDISACGVQMDWEDGASSRMLTQDGSCVLNTEDAMRAIIEESWLKQPVWYKLYKTELVRGILFPVGKYHEDVFWSYQAVGQAKKVCIFDQPCYHYIQRSGSIMGESYSLKRLDSLEAVAKRLHFVQGKMPQLESVAKINLFGSCIYAGQMSLMHLTKEQLVSAKRIINDAIGANKPSFMECLDTEGSNKLWFLLAKMSFWGTCHLKNALGRGL